MSRVELTNAQRELIWAMTVIARKASIPSVIDHREVKVELGVRIARPIHQLVFTAKVSV